MKNKLLPVFMTLTMLLLLVISLSSIEACDDGDDDEIEFDCELWSTDDAMVNLGVNSWPLLDGTASVSAYKINLNRCIDCNCINCCDKCMPCTYGEDCCIDCNCINCCDKCMPCTYGEDCCIDCNCINCCDKCRLCACNEDCCIDCNCINCCNKCRLCACCEDCCIDCNCCLIDGILTHRGTRGLGVLGGSNNDEIDVVCKTELIVVAFDEPQILCSFEVRSLYNESYMGEQVYEECDVALLLGCKLIQKYHLVGEELIGTGNGIAGVSDINQCFDRIVFYVDRFECYSPYSDFAVAKIKTSEDTISFVQPIVGVDCDNEINNAPIAKDDHYIVSEGGTLNVLESEGVLINDTDDDGDSLTAIKMNDPSNGMLLFNSDGSFEYIPNEDFSGIDSFTYKAYDGEDYSNEATVTITVTDVMPSITVTKTACPNVIVEPGCDVEFTVEVYNTGVEPVTLISLVDDVFGDLNGQGNCLVPNIIPVDSLYTCKFTVMISGNAEETHTNTVEATVKDNEENSATDNDSAFVIIIVDEEPNIPPVADADGPYEGQVNEAITFNGSKSYDLDGDIVNYTWDFGDETSLKYGIEITHIYTNTGEYTLNLTVKDDKDALDVNSTIVTVNEINNGDDDDDDDDTGDDDDDDSSSDSGRSISTIKEPVIIPPNEDPVADASGGEPYEGLVDEEITFNGSSSYDPDGEIVEWFWDFGDGTNVTGEIITHSYSNAGIYLVGLLVTDDDGAEDCYMTKIVIRHPNRPPTDPIVNYSISPNITNTKYIFTVMSTDPDGDNISYIVDWGDGSYDETDYLPDGTTATLNHTWSLSSKYIINISAVDENNASSGITALKVKIVDEPDEKSYFFLWWLLLLAILIAVLILVAVYSRKKEKKSDEE